MKAALTLFSLFVSIVLQAQISAGPMIGYVEFNEAAVWLEVENGTKKVQVTYHPQGDLKAKKKLLRRIAPSEFSYIPVTVILRDLEMDKNYVVTLAVDGKTVPQKLNIKTKKLWQFREDPPEFSFLFGSCAYINETATDRPGKPYGQSEVIFETMANTPSDFMMWGGDNLYFRPPDETSESGLRHRYHYSRSTKSMAALFASRPHYAAWDDHDYGPNDSNRTYKLKKTALQLWKEYWPQVTYGMDDNPGIYQHFIWEDIDFFMLDDRYHRTHPDLDDDSETMLGKAQLDWLKESLLTSRAPFKIVMTGSQVLNNHNPYEGFYEYPKEREELLNFIQKHNIKNVYFLNGDRHFTEIIEQQHGDMKFVDITCSPLSSGNYANLLENPEGKNPDRVDGTLVNTKQNFMKISFTGKRKERVMHISCLDKEGNELWNRSYPSAK